MGWQIPSQSFDDHGTLDVDGIRGYLFSTSTRSRSIRTGMSSSDVVFVEPFRRGNKFGSQAFQVLSGRRKSSELFLRHSQSPKLRRARGSNL